MKIETITLTYGELPIFLDFLHRYLEVCKHSDFTYSLVGSDTKLAEELKFPVTGPVKGVEMYMILERLTNAYGDGNEKAGDLAAAFMNVFGYKWV